MESGTWPLIKVKRGLHDSGIALTNGQDAGDFYRTSTTMIGSFRKQHPIVTKGHHENSHRGFGAEFDWLYLLDLPLGRNG